MHGQTDEQSLPEAVSLLAFLPPAKINKKR
jgi:hypothetical protein